MTNLKLPQESKISYFSRCLSEKPDTLYLNIVGIPSTSKKNKMKKIYLCNYEENDGENKDKWEVDSDGEVGPFFDAIADEKEFGDVRDNPVSMGGRDTLKSDIKMVSLFYFKMKGCMR